jgi:formate-dependent nitrite reductase membrane component NrfD
MKTQFAPLPGSFMILGMFGFIFALVFLREVSPPWTFITATFSVMLFGASLLSMTYAPIEDELLVDTPHKKVIISSQEALKRQKKSAKKKATTKKK